MNTEHEDMTASSWLRAQSEKLPSSPVWETTFLPFRDGETDLILVYAVTHNRPPLRIRIIAWLTGGTCRRISQ